MVPARSPEFALIARHFTQPVRRGVLGIGDDCALIDVTPGKQLAISTDTLVSGMHFFADADAEKLGHKALAVNLSDLAAMGASPRYFTLAITLPEINDVWLADFAKGMFQLADQYDMALIGGDTTRGPLSMTLTVIGQVAPGKALQRDHAKAGDDIWVSGALGGAALALCHLREDIKLKPNVLAGAMSRLHTPTPRVALGLRLVSLAHATVAAIDVSDGLIADLGHICDASTLTAEIDWPRIPCHPSLLSAAPDVRMRCALAGGDDYELCFTAPPSARAAVETISREMELPLTKIGVMKSGSAMVVVRNEHDQVMTAHEIGAGGFDHFTTGSLAK
ncbi:MAG: thiamine-phosphate kinase [Pseudomonadota bacterium]